MRVTRLSDAMEKWDSIKSLITQRWYDSYRYYYVNVSRWYQRKTFHVSSHCANYKKPLLETHGGEKCSAVMCSYAVAYCVTHPRSQNLTKKIKTLFPHWVRKNKYFCLFRSGFLITRLQNVPTLLISQTSTQKIWQRDQVAKCWFA